MAQSWAAGSQMDYPRVQLQESNFSTNMDMQLTLQHCHQCMATQPKPMITESSWMQRLLPEVTQTSW